MKGNTALEEITAWQQLGCRLFIAALMFWGGAYGSAELLIRFIPPDQLRDFKTAIYIIALAGLLVRAPGWWLGAAFTRRLCDSAFSPLVPVVGVLGLLMTFIIAQLLFFLIVIPLIH